MSFSKKKKKGCFHLPGIVTVKLKAWVCFKMMRIYRIFTPPAKAESSIFGGLHIEMEAAKLARLLSYRCLELGVTRCTSPEITHADTPSRQTASSTAERASGGMWARSHASQMVGKIFGQISDFSTFNQNLS